MNCEKVMIFIYAHAQTKMIYHKCRGRKGRGISGAHTNPRGPACYCGKTEGLEWSRTAPPVTRAERFII